MVEIGSILEWRVLDGVSRCLGVFLNAEVLLFCWHDVLSSMLEALFGGFCGGDKLLGDSVLIGHM